MKISGLSRVERETLSENVAARATALAAPLGSLYDDREAQRHRSRERTYEPSPSGSLDGSGLSVELGLEL
jgi:hypothetical protein